MKFNKSILAAAMIFGSVSMVNAADQGHGKITFTGSIIDAPCSIASESVDQTIELGQISTAALKNSGKSAPRNFDIKLENCSFGEPATKNKVVVTFTGKESTENKGLLGITGQAKGASIALTESNGELIQLGTPTTTQPLSDGINTLRFSAYVQGNGATATITEGEFQAVTDFTLAYN